MLLLNCKFQGILKKNNCLYGVHIYFIFCLHYNAFIWMMGMSKIIKINHNRALVHIFIQNRQHSFILLLSLSNVHDFIHLFQCKYKLKKKSPLLIYTSCTLSNLRYRQMQPTQVVALPEKFVIFKKSQEAFQNLWKRYHSL